jgi:hypothetical protein
MDHIVHNKPLREITPLDLLSTPRSPFQVCPDWNSDRPVSRYRRLCSAIKDDKRPSSRASSHIDRFLHDGDTADNNTWLNQSRPIYSSHQKVHPVTDRPNSSHLWNKYNYASHQRPCTPVIDHTHSVGHGHHNDGVKHVAPPTPSTTTSTKRYSLADEFDTHRRLGHHYHHDHLNPTRPPTNSTNVDRMPHYGTQLIKWAPPHYSHGPPLVHGPPHSHGPPHNHVSHHYKQPQQHQDPELSRPESRRCRSPAPFSSQLMKHKYTTSTNTSTNNNHHSSSPIKCWTPPTTTTNVNTDKVMMMSDGELSSTTLSWGRKSDKPQSTHRNSNSHRFNLWVPDTEEDEEEEDRNVNIDRSVILSLQ